MAVVLVARPCCLKAVVSTTMLLSLLMAGLMISLTAAATNSRTRTTTTTTTTTTMAWSPLWHPPSRRYLSACPSSSPSTAAGSQHAVQQRLLSTKTTPSSLSLASSLLSTIASSSSFGQHRPSLARSLSFLSMSSLNSKINNNNKNMISGATTAASSRKTIRSPTRSTTSSSTSLPMTSSSLSGITGGIMNTLFSSTHGGIISPILWTISTVLVGIFGFIKLVLDRPSRTYNQDTNTVGQEYDAWAQDGILEYYWGEHIHLGYYNPNEMKVGYLKKNFIQAKYDFIDQMMQFGQIEKSTMSSSSSSSTTTTTTTSNTLKILDVGCGVGGTTRYLAKNIRNGHVTGITLSPKQVERAQELAKEQKVAEQTEFLVMDALQMKFPNNTFDIVWACESGEHMPDKQQYINEMMRVLKPGGTFVMACWCQRDDTSKPLDIRDQRDLQYLYEEWTHPFFISIEKFASFIQNTNVMEQIQTKNWVQETIASWRHSIWVGIFDPRGWIFKPKLYMKCIRDAYCLERMHRAFQRGLMEYGMFTAVKKKE